MPNQPDVPNVTDGDCAGGRKVLFVDPPSVVQEQMIHFLVTAQYEAAIVKDPRRVVPVLAKFPCSIVYFNLDSRFPPNELEQIVRTLVSNRSRYQAEVGVLSYNSNPEAAKTYLMDIGASCGYVTLSLGFKQSARIIVRALEAAEARGQRRFVRVKAPAGRASLNVSSDGGYIGGTIIDLSIAGIACTLDQAFEKGTELDDLQLQLWGVRVKVSGTVAGVRQEGGRRVTVILFESISDSGTREKLYAFITRVMQFEVDQVSRPR